MPKLIPQISKGTKMSIAKAGLIIYYTKNVEDFDVGVPDLLHDIIDVAGAYHATFFTPGQVIARLRNSPYFKSKIIIGMYAGIRGNWKTSLLRPSAKGEYYYNKYLK